MSERNPEFAQLLNNPEMLRESVRVMSNPVSVVRRARIALVHAPQARGVFCYMPGRSHTWHSCHATGNALRPPHRI